MYAACMILFVFILNSITSCSPEILPGKLHVQEYQANANYNQDRWARQYRRLNNSKPKRLPSVTTQHLNKKVPSPIRY
jgi:hypothetical protein